MVTLSLAFGAFFGITVLTPLWLQIYMGYTATIAGYSTATMGVLAVFLAPLIANPQPKWTRVRWSLPGYCGWDCGRYFAAVRT